MQVAIHTKHPVDAMHPGLLSFAPLLFGYTVTRPAAFNKTAKLVSALL